MVVAGVLAGTTGVAGGEGFSPWWGVSAGARPTVLQPGSGVSEVQSITVAKPSEPQVIIAHRPSGQGQFVVKLAASETAVELQQTLEESNDFGAGNVEVTGTGAGDGSPFTVAFRGALASQAVPLFTAFSGATFAEVVAGHADGQVDVVATNLGDGDASGVEEPVRVEDVLPAGFRAVGVEAATAGVWQSQPRLHREGLSCEEASEVRVVCTFAGVVHPFEPVEVRIPVVLEAGVASGEENVVSVSGGGALVGRSVSRPLQVGGLAVFGVEENTLAAEEAGGAADTQAGSHPFQVTNTLTFNHGSLTPNGEEVDLFPVGLPKDAGVLVPAGLIGNVTSVAQCTDEQFAAAPHQANNCPLGSVVGVASVTLDEPTFAHLHVSVSPIFNLTPEAGEPARFGFEVDETVPVLFDVAVRTGGDYGVTISSHNISQIPGLVSSSTTLWGVPGDARHDGQRGVLCLVQESLCPLGEATPPPLLSMPTSCASALQASAVADSWENPTEIVDFGQSEPMPAMDGCNRLSFDPSIQVTPDGSAGSSSMGVNVDVHVPQSAALNPEGLAESAVKDVTVALPEGVAVNPAGGDGLQACSENQVGFTGITELQPGAKTATFTAKLPEPLQPGINFCPDASKIGTVKIKTPFLAGPLEGAVYLATQNENPFGSLLAVYLVAEDPVSGVLIKLAGDIHLTATGQILTTFENSPQAPFEDAELHFFGGERAPLSSPARCGSYTTTSSIVPWSGSPASEPQSTFNITSGPNGSPCPGANLPFAPSLTGGTTNINAGAFSPLTTTISRQDGSQAMQSVQLHMPPGLLGTLVGVKLCGEGEANAGTCTAASLIGETTVSAGVGSDPVSVTGGRVYITGPYHGAPFGLSIVDPVKAGPFDLEHDTSNPASQPACDCIVVRARVQLDPHTAVLSVTTNTESEGYAIPRVIDGVPVQIKKVNVLVNRSAFAFNPTSCARQALTGTIASDEGASAPVSVPFQAANCALLKFAPKFSANTAGAAHPNGPGASFHVRVLAHEGPGGGEANIKRVEVQLPKLLPARLTTLQKSCTQAQFSANPAGCPEFSFVGTATARTPVLSNALTGPAILVSHGGAAFPDLVIVLQGEGITLDLVGNTQIKNSITYSRFETIPDAPVSSFELDLPQSKHSALSSTSFSGLCGQNLIMPTFMEAQNGAQLHQNTQIAITGCKPKIKVLRHSVKGHTATIVVSVPAAGKLVATGKGLSRGTGKIGKGGSVTVKLTLSKSQQAFLAKHKGRKLKVNVKLLFTPTHGSKLSGRTSVLIR
jgi:hypothetical protein